MENFEALQVSSASPETTSGFNTVYGWKHSVMSWVCSGGALPTAAAAAAPIQAMVALQ